MAGYPSYIPARDADLATWLTNFDAIVAVDFASLGVSGGQAAAVTADVAAYNAAYTAAVDPGTRTPVTVSAKDAAKAQAVQTVRPIAILIRNNPAVSDPTKISLGLTVPVTTPTPIPAPTTFPILDFLAGTPGVHKLQSRDEATPTSKSKPFGALQLQLWVAVAAAPAPDPSTAVFNSVRTKSPFFVDTSEMASGQIATYFARWITRTGLVGPWSAGVSATVVA